MRTLVEKGAAPHEMDQGRVGGAVEVAAQNERRTRAVRRFVLAEQVVEFSEQGGQLDKFNVTCAAAEQNT